MYLSILALPLFGALTAGLLGRKIGVTGSHIITCTFLVISALLSIVVFMEVGVLGSPVLVNLASWIDTELMLANWSFLFDSLTVSMLMAVLIVSSLVHIFSIDYMANDPHNQRFFAYLSMFTFFMLVLIAGDSYLVMFLGWEGYFIDSPKWDSLFFSLFFTLVFILFFTSFIPCFFHIEGKLHSHKRIGPHSLEVLQVIIGTLLGDGHLEKRKRGIGTRLLLEQTSRNVEYLMWLHHFFSLRGYCSSLKPKLFQRIKRNNTVYYGVKFTTFTFSSFNWLHDQFYPGEGLKHLPISLLTEYLNEQALAIWFMDDGSKFGTGFKISTHCFIFNELEQFCTLLKWKYNINCSINSDRDYWTLYIKKDSAQRFANLVEPYMLDSMKYKLGSYSRLEKKS
jgi:LAGLIDADG DNA endonuclease family/NADH-Ubiquinone oxidoreductase (complex I), chain 5 N-terminus